MRRGIARRLGLRLPPVRPRGILYVRKEFSDQELVELRERWEAVVDGYRTHIMPVAPVLIEMAGAAQKGSPGRTAQPRRLAGCGVRRSSGSRRASTCSCVTSVRRRRSRSVTSRA
jgi:hypothetical protein